jgi:hypothetical protein
MPRRPREFLSAREAKEDTGPSLRTRSSGRPAMLCGYCGPNNVLPRGYDYWETRYRCLQKGFGAGKFSERRKWQAETGRRIDPEYPSMCPHVTGNGISSRNSGNGRRNSGNGRRNGVRNNPRNNPRNNHRNNGRRNNLANQLRRTSRSSRSSFRRSLSSSDEFSGYFSGNISSAPSPRRVSSSLSRRRGPRSFRRGISSP